jgi:hypothetical protein
MAQLEQKDFQFPDEIEASTAIEQDDENQIEIEMIDDTPEEDKVNSSPMPKDIVDEVDQDDLESYSKQAKERLQQMKKIMHDERRAKEAALKEQQEAIRVAQAIVEENKRLKGKLTEGEKSLVSNVRQNISYELEKAKQEYKDAYDSGDSDRLVDAQEKLTEVKFKSQQIDQYKPEFSEDTLQTEEYDVKMQSQPPQLDSKTQSWLDKNQWYGVDEDMSYLAHGIHRRLEKEGVPIGSEFYWSSIDAEVRKRFPEKFQESEETKYSSSAETKYSAKSSKPSTVVAPATRSTSPKRVKLTQRQVQLAKKLNLTPEQYALAQQKLESQNG